MPIANIIFLTIFIGLSAFFSASEAAIFSLSELRIKRLQEKHPQAHTIKRLLQRPTRLLSTINFGNMLVNTGFSSLCTTIFVSAFGDKGLAIAIFASGIILLFLGEIFPKTIAIYLAEKIAIIFTPALNFFSEIFSPLTFLTEWIVDFFSSFAYIFPHKSAFTNDELKTAISLSRRDGHISYEEEALLDCALEFKDTWVSEIATPRVDVCGISSKASQEEAMQVMRGKKYSKFPVYDNSLDNIAGILYAKDAFLNQDKDFRKFLKEPIFVPESKKIADMLKIFLEKKERIAVVLDEYGGTRGIITLEDIEEEIFGDIYDEFEVPKNYIEELNSSTYRIYAKLPVKTVNLELDLKLPEEENTIAGFLLSRIERIPSQGEKFVFQGTEFTVERVTPKRIISIIIKKRQ